MVDDNAIPDYDSETAIQIGHIDLQIEELLRSLFEDIEEYDLAPIDRTLLTHYMRLSYLRGWVDRHHGVLPSSS